VALIAVVGCGHPGDFEREERLRRAEALGRFLREVHARAEPPEPEGEYDHEAQRARYLELFGPELPAGFVGREFEVGEQFVRYPAQGEEDAYWEVGSSGTRMLGGDSVFRFYETTLIDPDTGDVYQVRNVNKSFHGPLRPPAEARVTGVYSPAEAREIWEAVGLVWP
jgi:hypothetical protein